ncbi:MAG: hypothetical protein WAK00_14805 [Microbacterium sp.]|uniref:hypothetical protein n=1 Tax=Microbacterium sp. TaxID=51671 RepID=UPI003BB0C564
MPQPKVTLFALLAGVLMATFQLLRPWGDISEDPQSMAEAFADTRWVIAHLAGAASFVMLAALARVAAVASSAKTGTGRPTRVAGIAQVAMATGAALVLPYYGAETFALHELGRAFLGGASLDIFGLSTGTRMNPAAIALFGVGLLLIAVAGVCLSLARVRGGTAWWSAWPLGVLVAFALPQFALPPAGRVAYGVAFLIAAIVFAVSRPAKHRAAARAAG